MLFHGTRKLVPFPAGENDVKALSYNHSRRRTRDNGVVTRPCNRFLGNSRSRRTRRKSTVKWGGSLNFAWDRRVSSRQTLAHPDRNTKIILLYYT